MKHRFNLVFTSEVLSQEREQLLTENITLCCTGGERTLCTLQPHRGLSLPFIYPSLWFVSLTLVHSDDHGQQCPHSVCQSIEATEIQHPISPDEYFWAILL